MAESLRMHDDEIVVDEALVGALLASQFPEWAELPIRRVTSGATVNAIFRLGEEMVVRLPRIPRYHDVEAEIGWLEDLAGRLPLAIPEPLAMGCPDEVYPWKWALFRWLDGEPWRMDVVEDPCAAATELAKFLQALHELDPGSLSPVAPVRVKPLAASDWAVREYGEKAAGLVDFEAVLEAWEQALELPDWSGEPVLVHGDVLVDNVLVRGGKLYAVIDWAGLHVGDPADDLTPAWSLLTGEARAVFRSMMGADDQSWARARARALGRITGVGYYAETNPLFVADSCRVVEEALADCR